MCNLYQRGSLVVSNRFSSFNVEQPHRNIANGNATRRAILIAEAKNSLIARRARSAFVDSSILNEPGWDMLLALYIAEESEARNSISRLTEFSGAPLSTALRWIDHLGRLGLTSRVAHPTDVRTSFVELTNEGRDALDSYFNRIIAMKCDGGSSTA